MRDSQTALAFLLTPGGVGGGCCHPPQIPLSRYRQRTVDEYQIQFRYQKYRYQSS